LREGGAQMSHKYKCEPILFLIRRDILNDFLQLCGKLGLDKNSLVEAWMATFVKKQGDESLFFEEALGKRK
jgi:hypothetical protein